MSGFEVEQVEGVEPPRRARVEEADPAPESLGEKLERKRDYLEGFLAATPEGIAAGEPGGDLYESVISALREIFEETGWRIELGRLIGVYSDPARQTVETVRGERAQLVNLCFEAAPVGTTGAPTTPDEALASGYFALDALPEPLVPIHRVRIQDAAAGGPGTQVR